MKPALVPVLLALALTPAKAEPVPKIFSIWDSFIIARTAAITCNVSDPENDKRSASNFLTVSAQLMVEFGRLRPDLSPKQKEEYIAKRVEILQSATRKKVEQSGCASADVQKLLKFNEAIASMKFPPSR